ncbi:MAG: GNAT family N-acetyltransferase [Erysipelotrichaceae bacterium]|jgi:GNAT superfamily N-acetyltransferase|nr:GNAT family N-acetyltransferase [Erysipelotrichaceae bacterium]
MAEIRRAFVVDNHVLSILISHYFNLPHKNCIKIIEEENTDPEVVYFLAYAQRMAVGFARGSLLENALEVDAIYVAPEHRYQGIGRALLQALRDYAKETGKGEFYCELVQAQLQSEDFFTRCGLNQTSRIVRLKEKL